MVSATTSTMLNSLSRQIRKTNSLRILEPSILEIPVSKWLILLKTTFSFVPITSGQIVHCTDCICISDDRSTRHSLAQLWHLRFGQRRQCDCISGSWHKRIYDRECSNRSSCEYNCRISWSNNQQQCRWMFRDWLWVLCQRWCWRELFWSFRREHQGTLVW